MTETASELAFKRLARRLYNRLQWLSLISVPWFLFMVMFILSGRSSTFQRVGAAVLPAAPFVLMLAVVWLDNSAPFIRGHTAMGFVLVGLRTLTASISVVIARYPWDGLWFFLLANSLLWFFGSFIGRRRVTAGKGFLFHSGEVLSSHPSENLVEGVKEEHSSLRGEGVCVEEELRLKKIARNLYLSQRWLAFLSVPFFIMIVLFLYQPSLFELMIAIGVPAIPYLLGVYIIASASDHPFVRGHRKQVLSLIVLRAFTAFLIINRRSPEDGLPFFFLVNGLQWFFGPRLSLKQVNEGVGMFVRVEDRLSSRPIDALKKALEQLPGDSVRTKRSDDPHPEISRDRAEAVAGYLSDFRAGNSEARARALHQLEALDEVEVF